jgi:glycine cleavage system regulatory protein
MTQVVLSVVGSDRPGLTQALAAAVVAAGGNWLESHLSQLGGLYVGSVLVEVEADGLPALRAGVQKVDAQGLDVRLALLDGVVAEPPAPAGATLDFFLVGQDQPGIVNDVTAALAALGANIESFETWISAEPQTGLPLFHVDAQLRLPDGLSAATVQAALENISAEIMVDFTLDPAD